ncbi:MAG TPA: sugar ABC transporter ATP-binding protein [Chloroflexi bacterium]|nr:sugar ABC transporter ATP-binding protein [Chloroflexota bacterium]
MLSTSLKTQEALFRYPPQWLPEPTVWRNYITAWQILPFTHMLFNTVFVTVLAMFAEIASAALVAYGFARFRFPGRNVLFMLMLSTMMLPWIVTLIPVFVIWRKLDLVNTYDPLVLGAWFAWGPAYIFLLRQFFLTIPREIEEAAIIDGANTIQILFSVMLPLVKPALLAIAVMSFQGNWNNFKSPLIYLNNPIEKYTMSLGLFFFQGTFNVGGGEAPKWHLMMAMTTVMIIPILILFFLAQRYFIEGLTVGGVKG